MINSNPQTKPRTRFLACMCKAQWKEQQTRYHIRKCFFVNLSTIKYNSFVRWSTTLKKTIWNNRCDVVCYVARGAWGKVVTVHATCYCHINHYLKASFTLSVDAFLYQKQSEFHFYKVNNIVYISFLKLIRYVIKNE